MHHVYHARDRHNYVQSQNNGRGQNCKLQSFHRAHRRVPDRDLVFRPSTRLPFRYVIFGAERHYAHARADLLEIAFREPVKRPGNGAVALQQE